MSVFGVIQSECEKIRTRIIPNTDTFHAVFIGILNWHFNTKPFFLNSNIAQKVTECGLFFVQNFSVLWRNVKKCRPEKTLYWDVFHIFKMTSAAIFPTSIFLLIVNNTNTKTSFEICSKFNKDTKTPLVILVSLLLTLKIFHTLFLCFY